MKTLNSIPTTKIERAGKLVKTGVKIGGNYLKYYGQKITDPSNAKNNLDENNATDIYDGLKSLKGSALKVAQMLSMEKNLLPRAYVEKFSLSQYSVPPLSGPLVRKTFKKYFDLYPEQIFEEFGKDAINAASIGQVHKGRIGSKWFAIKIQYPGIAESISSDLALVKPIALKMFNLKPKESEKYFQEVENKLYEETNYILELQQSQEISNAAAMIPNLQFPKYYPEYSSERILTMDWMDGVHWGEFAKSDFSPEIGNRLGQTLWDFYMLQIHGLKKVHADPHPGNFLIGEQNQLIAIDFGCIKVIPDDFYYPYFELANKDTLANLELFKKQLFDLEILTQDDNESELTFFTELFHELLSIFTAPFQSQNFDFGDEVYWSKISTISEKLSQNQEIRKMNSNRGSKHFLYINRTFFGLYNLLYDLKSTIEVQSYKKYLQ